MNLVETNITNLILVPCGFSLNLCGPYLTASLSDLTPPWRKKRFLSLSAPSIGSGSGISGISGKNILRLIQDLNTCGCSSKSCGQKTSRKNNWNRPRLPFRSFLNRNRERNRSRGRAPGLRRFRPALIRPLRRNTRPHPLRRCL